MVYQRQMGEPVDLRAALPQVGKVTPYDYDSALRQRLRPTDDIGTQQNQFASAQAAIAQQKAYQARLAGLQQAGQAGGSAPVMVNGKWYNPTGTNMKPTFGFGETYKDGGTHHGADFAIKAGSPVYAPYGGKIAVAGWDPDGLGNSYRIDNGNGTWTRLGHLQELLMKAGQTVTPGMLLGYSGSTGKSTGPHLHMELDNALYGGTPLNFNSYYGW